MQCLYAFAVVRIITPFLIPTKIFHKMCYMGTFLKPLATINLAKSATFLGNFCIGVKIYHFSSEIILGDFYRHLAIFSGHTVTMGS